MTLKKRARTTWFYAMKKAQRKKLGSEEETSARRIPDLLAVSAGMRYMFLDAQALAHHQQPAEQKYQEDRRQQTVGSMAEHRLPIQAMEGLAAVSLPTPLQTVEECLPVSWTKPRQPRLEEQTWQYCPTKYSDSKVQ